MAKKANGEGTLTSTIRNGKTYYIGSVTIGWDTNGKQIRKTFGSFKKTVVIDKMNTVKYEAKKNMLSSTEMTFGEFFKNWIYKFKRVEVSNNTFFAYETSYRLRIEPHRISYKKMNDITLHDLQDYFNELQEKWSAKTIKDTYIRVHACFRFAVIQNAIVRNYLPGVTLQKIESKESINVFSREEQEKVIEALDLCDIIDCLIYFAFYTGLRLSEVLAVKWCDINNNVLKVQRQYRRETTILEDGTRNLKYVFEKLKTKNSEREIPLPKKVIDMLEKLDENCELIFHDKKNKPLDLHRPQRRIVAICKILGIPHRSFHSIRHSYATRLFELNIPLKTVQVLLGHSDVATTMDVYTHVMLDKKMEILDKLNEL